MSLLQSTRSEFWLGIRLTNKYFVKAGRNHISHLLCYSHSSTVITAFCEVKETVPSLFFDQSQSYPVEMPTAVTAFFSLTGAVLGTE